MISPGELFFPLAETSFRISLAIALLLLLRPRLRRWIGSQGMALLWLPLLIRLLLPLPVAVPWHLMPASFYGRGEPVGRHLEMETRGAEKERATGEETGPEASAPARSGIGGTADLLGTIWLSGFLTGLGWLALRAIRTRRLAGEAVPATEPALLEIFQSLPLELRSRVSLKTTRAVESPVLTGAFRPQIWIPQEWRQRWTAAEMRHILWHELGHARRRDLLVQGVFSIAQCLHWFHPLVWVAGHYARLDREMACDAWVLTWCGRQEAQAYGTTLVKTARGLRRFNPARGAEMLGMASARSHLSARIAAIGGFSPVSPWRGGAGVLVAFMALGGLTTVGKAREPKRPSAIVRFVPPAKPSASAPEPLAFRVEARVFHFPEAELPLLNEAVGEGTTTVLPLPLAEKLLERFRRKKGVEMVTLPTVTTRFGNGFSVDVVKEVRYARLSPQKAVIGHQTREVGFQLTATPLLASDRETIHLAFRWGVTRLISFTQYGESGTPVRRIEPGGRWLERIQETSYLSENPLNQPTFSTRSVHGSTSLFHGQALLSLGGKAEAGEGRELLVLTPVLIQGQLKQ
ncbi:MAG TPA: M56 family metallopeptidase [Chthoniobacteraceae bacterium]|nr:M56 family metallopeptidase [Chthoniobacteraceae bacterium]